MGLAHLAGTAAGSPAANADPIVAVPLDRRPSEEPVMIPISSSSAALDRETTAAAAAAASWNEDNDGDGGGAGAGAGGSGFGFGTVFDYRDHRKAGWSQPRWGSYRSAGHASLSWAEGSTARGSGSSVLRDGFGVGSTDASGGGSKGGGGGGNGGAPGPPPSGWPVLQQPAQEEPPYHHQQPPVFDPTGGKRTKGGLAGGGCEFPAPGSGHTRGGYAHGATPSWTAAAPPTPSAAAASGVDGYGDRYRETGSLPATLPSPDGYAAADGATLLLSPPIQERGGVAVDAPFPSAGARDTQWRSYTPSSSAAAEAAVGMTRRSPPRSWGTGPVGRSGGGGGGLASLGLGGTRWRGVGVGMGSGCGDGGSDGVREYTGGDVPPNNEREVFRDDREQLVPPPRGPYHQRLPSRPQEELLAQDRRSPLCSTFSPGAGTTVTPPRLGGGGGSDRGSHDAAPRPPFTVVSDTTRPTLPGLTQAVATAGDQPGAGRKVSAFGAIEVDLTGAGGGGGGGGGGRGASAATAATAGEKRKQRRRYNKRDGVYTSPWVVCL